MSEPQTTLSASRIKTAESCSWLYWCKYKLNLPDKSNDGARRGSICHLVFEVLGNPRHRKHFEQIKKTLDVFSSKPIKRLIMKHAIREGVDDDDNVLLMKEMTLNGLMYDFFGDTHSDPTEEHSEKDFHITVNNRTVKYKIRGFIDKLFLYEDKKYALIRDFKTSKATFKGKELEDNMQDLMYSLAVRHMFPEYETKQSEFLFLKFDLIPDVKDTGVIQMTPLDEDDLHGFEHHLTDIQEYLDNFDESSAKKNMAAYKGFPSDGSFSCKLLCGFAKEKGQLKKDGTPMWHCGMKFDFFYHEIKDKDGNFLKTCFEEDFSEDMVPEGGCHEMKYYAGCPAHSS